MSKPSIAEKILKGKKDPTLQKNLQSEQLDTTAETEDKMSTKLQNSKRLKKQQEDKKRKFRLIVGGISVLVVSYMGYYLFKPYEGGMTFGICKVFLERNVRYPATIRMSSVEEFSDFLRIWFTQIDPFGQYRMENIRCTYEADENYGLRLKKVHFNRREVDPAIVTEFNKTIPIILTYPPDLTYPSKFPNSLKDLQIETDRFRKQIF